MPTALEQYGLAGLVIFFLGLFCWHLWNENRRLNDARVQDLKDIGTEAVIAMKAMTSTTAGAVRAVETLAAEIRSRERD